MAKQGKLSIFIFSLKISTLYLFLNYPQNHINLSAKTVLMRSHNIRFQRTIPEVIKIYMLNSAAHE